MIASLAMLPTAFLYAAESVHLHADLAGAQIVELSVCDAGNGITKDHADWANAYFTMKDGARPVKAVSEQLGILTPPPSAAPRINRAPKGYPCADCPKNRAK